MSSATHSTHIFPTSSTTSTIPWYLLLQIQFLQVFLEVEEGIASDFCNQPKLKSIIDAAKHHSCAVW